MPQEQFLGRFYFPLNKTIPARILPGRGVYYLRFLRVMNSPARLIPAMIPSTVSMMIPVFGGPEGGGVTVCPSSSMSAWTATVTSLYLTSSNATSFSFGISDAGIVKITSTLPLSCTAVNVTVFVTGVPSAYFKFSKHHNLCTFVKKIRFQTSSELKSTFNSPLHLCKNIRFQNLKSQSPHGIPASSAPYLVLMQSLPVFPCSIYPLREGRQHAPRIFHCFTQITAPGLWI